MGNLGKLVNGELIARRANCEGLFFRETGFPGYRDTRLPGAELIGIYRREERNAPLRRGALIKERAVGLVLVGMVAWVLKVSRVIVVVMMVLVLSRLMVIVMLMLVVVMVLVRAAVMVLAGVLSVFKLQSRVGDIMLL